jgi:hypothetical protein
MSELWRPIPDFEGIYQVSSLGRVRSLDRRVWSSRGFWAELRGQVLGTSALPSGHLHVGLRTGGKRVNRLVHRLVLEAFVGPCPDGMEACHWDGDPTNNSLSNLRWDSRSANRMDAVRHGTNHNTRKSHCPQGHPYSPENTRTNGRSRACRECAREHTRKWRERRGADPLAATTKGGL